MKTGNVKIGVCGLSCRLCPAYNAGPKSWCKGCKTESRTAVGCPFITCAVKKKGIKFCWECAENETCARWRMHRDYGKSRDSFKCYQTLESDIGFILKNGVATFEKLHKEREQILKKMLNGFNDKRSKSYYCIAATVMDIRELELSLARAKRESRGMNIKEKAILMHSILDGIAARKGYILKLRK